ncbi:tRNA (guanine(10)-N(2))-dimethyltransferase [Candidatus Woesearchaeota archaeon]|nr:tRNA (guanine(10)-N(2))-dimethyltransferase [Candidatus Woesearchaeota archaeon]
MHEITEGLARIAAPPAKIIARNMGVFYNPAMKLNRDITILILNSLKKKGLQAADPLAGTGIRSIRMLLELDKGVIKSISANDSSRKAANAIRKNLKLNRIPARKLKVTSMDANMFLLQSTGFDYIDIDPFGYPGKFLDAAAERLSRNGILAVTATDTAALSGSSPQACIRKYWAMPLRNEFMHETAIRILIRRVQLAGMEREKSLTPIFSYADQHYVRSFFTCQKGRQKASQTARQHGYILYCRKCLHRESCREPQGMAQSCPECGFNYEYAGPLWLGKTTGLTSSRMAKGEHKDMITMIAEESAIKQPWFFNTNRVCSKHSIRSPLPVQEAIKRLVQQGHQAVRTHLDPSGIKTSATATEVAKALRT